MSLHRKKPVVIEAVQWRGNNFGEVGAFCQAATGPYYNALFIDTDEGKMRADIGDWIIKGVAGEFYPCKPDIFAETYEEAE